jgi:hypothetical protein
MDMSAAVKYKVILSGEVEEGYDADHALAAFAELFKVSDDQARVFFEGKPRVLRKDLEEPQAQAYLKALQKIGLDPKLLQQSAPGKQQPAVMAGTTAADARGQPGETQPQNASAIVGKALDSANIVALGAAAVAALVGALVWMLIAVGFGYELGIVAWGIGGAVGFAAAILGGRGKVSGGVCGALALAAILGGKLLAMGSIQSTLADVMADEELWNAETQAYFEELRTDAKLYGSLGSDEYALRRFIVDRGYSEAESVDEVTAEDLSFFREYEAPSLNWIASNNPSYEEWQSHTMQAITEISTLDLVISELGALDLIFLLLGIGTAFRLGSGGLREEDTVTA